MRKIVILDHLSCGIRGERPQESTGSTVFPDGLAKSLLFQLRPDVHLSSGCQPYSGFTARQMQSLCESLCESWWTPRLPRGTKKNRERICEECGGGLETVSDHPPYKRDDGSLGDLRNGYDLTDQEFYCWWVMVTRRPLTTWISLKANELASTDLWITMFVHSDIPPKCSSILSSSGDSCDGEQPRSTSTQTGPWWKRDLAPETMVIWKQSRKEARETLWQRCMLALCPPYKHCQCLSWYSQQQL